MTKLTNRQKIDMRIAEENEKLKKPVVKKTFFHKRKYVDPCTGLVFDRCETLAENKKDYLKAFAMVARGEAKSMFDAHKVVC